MAAQGKFRLKHLLTSEQSCWLCGQQVVASAYPGSPVRPSTDHVREKRNGGRNTGYNYRIAHRWCNSVRMHYPNPTVHPRYIEAIAARLLNAQCWDETIYVKRTKGSHEKKRLA